MQLCGADTLVRDSRIRRSAGKSARATQTERDAGFVPVLQFFSTWHPVLRIPLRSQVLARFTAQTAPKK